jgi:hypothetical protein
MSIASQQNTEVNVTDTKMALAVDRSPPLLLLPLRRSRKSERRGTTGMGIGTTVVVTVAGMSCPAPVPLFR